MTKEIFGTAEEALHTLFKELEFFLVHTDEDGSNYFIDGLCIENIYNGSEFMKMTISHTENGWELNKEV